MHNKRLPNEAELNIPKFEMIYVLITMKFQ